MGSERQIRSTSYSDTSHSNFRDGAEARERIGEKAKAATHFPGRL
jgi:hypothetical protein